MFQKALDILFKVFLFYNFFIRFGKQNTNTMEILEIEFIDKTENFAWTKIKYKTFFGKEKESYIITTYLGKVDVRSKLWPSGKDLPYSLKEIVVSFIERALKNKI